MSDHVEVLRGLRNRAEMDVRYAQGAAESALPRARVAALDAAIAALSAPAEAQPVAYSRAPVDGRLNPITPREYAWLRESGGGEGFRPLVYGDTAQPTAEAQPVANWCRTCGRRPKDPIAALCPDAHHKDTTPPSAPVGVECVRCGNRPEGGETTKLPLLGLVEYARTEVNPSQGATRWHLIDLLEQALPHLEVLAQQPAAVDEAASLDTERVETIKRMRFGVVPVEGGGWDVYVYDADGGKETLISSAKDVRHAIDEAVALAGQQGGET